MSSRERSPTSSERTPLLPRDEEPTKEKNRLPSWIALGALCVAAVFAIIFGFATPAAVQEYAKEAITFKPTDLSIDSITNWGVRARVQGVFYFDASKVHDGSVRNLGRAATWIAREVESGESDVEIYLPEYDDALLGTVTIPPIKLNIRNGHDNFINMVADIEPGDVNGLRDLAHDFMAGKQKLDVKAVARVPIKSGLISLGTQTVTQFMTVKRGGDIKQPDVDILGLRVSEYGQPGHPEGLIASANVSAMNEYPVKFDIPPLAFDVMLLDCSKTPLVLGTMKTDLIHVLPKQNVTAAVTGFMKQLPTALTSTCPDSEKSPLDAFIGAYLEGNTTSIYVKGGEQGQNTPLWIGDILKSMTIAVPVPSHPFGNTIKNFSLEDVNFSLPGLEGGSPRLSANINVVVGLPKDIDMEISVDRVRADADMYYKGKKLGELGLHEWQNASSKKVGDDLHVKSEVVNAPLKITDQDVFTEVLQSMIFGHGVKMTARAVVDVSSTTALGKFVVRGVPGEGDIFIEPVGGKMEQTVKDISVAGSTREELIMKAVVEVDNPTQYSAHIPYVNISVFSNDTQLGYAWGSFDVGPGLNTLTTYASYRAGVGAELLSQFISGYNASLTIKTHEGSVPGFPDPKLAVTVPIPHMFGKFLKETTVWNS